MCTQPNGGYVYKIKLTAQNRNTGCLNHSTTTDAYAYFSPIADFLAPAEICIDYPEATFTNKTCPLNTPNTKIFWSFGDPASGTADTSTLLNPTHRFTATGLYTVKLPPAVGASRTSIFIVLIDVLQKLETVNFTV